MIARMERAADKGIGLGGFGLRFAFALALVYASYNPWGISYVAWVIGTWTPADESSWFGSPALKFVVGTALAIAWVVYGTAARTWFALASTKSGWSNQLETYVTSMSPPVSARSAARAPATFSRYCWQLE